MQTAHSPLGVYIFTPTAPNGVHTSQNAHYITEILGHAGVPYRLLETEALPALLESGIKILLTSGNGVLESAASEAIKSWVETGGQWLSLGSVCGLEEVLGVETVPSPGIATRPNFYPYGSIGEGYLKPLVAHPIFEQIVIPLHFYNGYRVKTGAGSVLASALDYHGRETETPVVIEAIHGQGRTLFIAADVVDAVIRIQQGTAVTCDGVSAPDGSAPVADGVLKCDDGLVLDWYFDRQEIPETNGLKGFLQPVADQWRELILRAIFHFAGQQDIALPVLWLYPRNLPAMAHISHDTDGNDLEKGKRLLEVMGEAGIHSTWCTITPGYPRDFMEKIKAAGHELSLHYNALDHPWSEEEFDAQYKELVELFGEQPISNKNHYTRWENGTEFFDWCARRNIWIEQSKGPSKPGEIGFTFGSGQLYFPLADDGTIHTVLEQPLHSQDLRIVSPPSVVPVLLDAIEKHHGILHLLFHPAWILTDGVADSLLDSVRQGKERGMEWVTARWLNDWERSRRAVEWKGITSQAQPAVELTELAEATVLVLGRHEKIEVNGELHAAQTTTRWGFEFSFVTLS